MWWGQSKWKLSFIWTKEMQKDFVNHSTVNPARIIVKFAMKVTVFRNKSITRLVYPVNVIHIWDHAPLQWIPIMQIHNDSNNKFVNSKNWLWCEDTHCSFTVISNLQVEISHPLGNFFQNHNLNLWPHNRMSTPLSRYLHMKPDSVIVYRELNSYCPAFIQFELSYSFHGNAGTLIISSTVYLINDKKKRPVPHFIVVFYHEQAQKYNIGSSSFLCLSNRVMRLHGQA